MKRNRIKKEAENWLEAGVISDKQLEEIMSMYEKKDRSYIIVLLATILVSLSVIIFVLSDWAQIPDVAKIIIMTMIMVFVYVLGFYLYQKDKKQQDRNALIGISFITVGYVLFGAIMLLTIAMYNVNLLSAWPFLWWSLLGLLLYIAVSHSFLINIALLVTIAGQLYSSIQIGSFYYILFLIYLIGYFHYVFHRGTRLMHYIFSLGLAGQLLLLSIIVFEQFYFFLLLLLSMFALSLILPKQLIYRRMVDVTIISLLLYKVYESLVIQDEFMMEAVQLRPGFFILYSLLFIVVLFILSFIRKEQRITLILFIPIFFIPYAQVFIIGTLFVYAVYLVFYSIKSDDTRSRGIGFISFFIAIVTVLLQYDWDTLTKSIIFLLTGFALFFFYVMIERKKRKEGRSSQ
ncbi:MAG TPA: DUF2157 domain-containing protein [Pseudogracilibacillus sp.]|nr:DUF2157 domain-containing protein [Pseudogracilibacillus sp.]